jgi:hypothetical protein
MARAVVVGILRGESMTDSTDLRAEELAAIGRIAIRDAGLNQLVEYMCWDLIDADDDNVGATVTKNLSYARVIGLLQSLVSIRLPESHRRTRLLEWIRKAQWAHKERNSIVHSALVRLNPEERLTRFRIVPGEDEAMLVIESFNTRSLDYLADAMGQIAEEGLELFPETEVKMRPPSEGDLPTRDDAV